MATGYDLTALNDWTEERATEFFSRSVLSGVTAQFVETLTGIKGATKLPDMESDYDLFQDGTTCSETLLGEVRIDQTEIDSEPIRVLMQFCIRELEKKFTRQYLRAGQDYVALPFEDQMMFEIARQINKTVELNLWQGEKGGANAVASLNLMDGYNKVITDYIAALAIPVAQQLSTGALTDANIVAAAEDMYKVLPVDQFQGITDIQDSYKLFVGTDKAIMYDRGYRDAYGQNTNYRGFSRVDDTTRIERPVIDGTTIEIIGVPGLFGTDKMVLARPSRMWMAVDIEGEETNLRAGLTQYEENVWLKSRFRMGTQIQFPEELVVNNY